MSSVFVRRAILLAAGGILVPACGGGGGGGGSLSPSIALSASAFAFTAVEGGTDPGDQTVNLTNRTGSSLAWAASSDQPWLTTIPSSGILAPHEMIAVSLHVDATYQVSAWVGGTGAGGSPPTNRTVHTAVWTGNEMIVWAGTSVFSPYTQENTGSRYNPVADSWTATTTTGAPLARHAHSAVWTGSRMIIWGGWSGSNGLFGTGASYSPDTWFGAIAAAGAPSVREGHTAVWTGTDMIVWGGHSSPNEFNTGAFYNPASDSWTGATTTTGAPTPRWEHAAAWTGSRMVVWGGHTGSSATGTSLDTGGIYDPGANSWIAMSTTGALGPRSKATAVWTGREIIFWGGWDGSIFYNTGSRFDPVTNTWLGSLPTAGAPGIRAAHSAIWTGSRMIVWGGQDTASNFLGSGGIYQPPIPALGNHSGTITVSAPGGLGVLDVDLVVTP